MHHYVLSVIHPVERVADAVGFLVETLGFTAKEVAETHAVVENGALQVRLVAAKDRQSFANWPLELEVVTKDIPTTCRQLTRQDTVWELTAELPVAPNRIEKRLGTAQGIVLVLTRDLGEDDSP